MNANTILIFFANMIWIFLIKTDNALCFLLSNVAVYFIVWIVLELNCRKLIGSKNDGNTFSFDELIKNIKAGILLTVGNLSSVVLTSMDRWFVKALMTTLAFAQYSFAVSMENFMNVAVTPVTTTLYNYFCKATDEVKVRKARNYVMIFAALIVSCAFPARFILEVYLTKYIDSAKVMFLLFAAQIFYIVIKSIYVNLYKAQKKQSIYFIKLTAIIVVGFVFNVICYNLYKVKESFAVGTLLSAVYSQPQILFNSPKPPLPRIQRSGGEAFLERMNQYPFKVAEMRGDKDIGMASNDSPIREYQNILDEMIAIYKSIGE